MVGIELDSLEGFLMGTGILPYDIPPEKVLAVKQALDETASP